MSDGPILPCHPDACVTCGGTDWDVVHNVPCTDASWCQEHTKSADGFGWHVCNLSVGHMGSHKCGAVMWDSV